MGMGRAHGMIGALWEATTQRQLNITMGVCTAYVGYICMSFWRDTSAVTAFNAVEDKRPAIMQRPSINAWMEKEAAKSQ